MPFPATPAPVKSVCQDSAYFCYQALAHVRNDALADDLTQEIFVRVLRQLPEVRDHQRVIGWISQIARNVVADHFRHSRPLEPIRETEATEQPARAALIETEETHLHDELATYVRDVMKSLPPIYREAIWLTEYEGMTQVELARHLGLPSSTTKSRVQRARQRVRAWVEKCGHVEFDAYGTLVNCQRREPAPRGECS